MTQYGVAGQGSSVQCPTQTTTYNLTVIYNNGASETRSITIYVTPAPVGAPVINLFTVTPSQIQPGQCVNVQWDVAGSVTQIVLTRGGTTIWANAPVRSTMQDCPPGTGSVTYTLVATGPGGQSQGQQYVNVVAPPTAVPPTAVPPTAGSADSGAANSRPTDSSAADGSAADRGPRTADRGQKLDAADLQQRPGRRWCPRSPAPRSRPCSGPTAK